MAKKSFTTAPTKTKKPVLSDSQIDAFTKGGGGTDKAQDEPLKRLAVNVPESLHTRYKVACARAKIKMAPEIITFIEKRVKELEST